MKKLLLIAFTLFSMNTFAQTPMLKATRLNGLKAENSMKFETSNRVNLKKANSTNKVKAQAAPEGTTKSYYADYGESVTQVGLMQRLHVKNDIVFGNDGTVSIPNMFLSTIVGEGIYLKGTYDESTKEITIENNQEIYNQDGISLFVCKMDAETGEPLTSSSFKLSLDPESGIYYSAEGEYLTAFITNGSQTEIYTYCTELYYYPAELFPEAVSHKYTYSDYYGNSKSATVDIVNLGDICYIKSLMPEYPEAWMIGMFEGNDIIVSSYGVASDDTALLFGTTTDFVDDCTFTYSSSSDSYTSESGIELTDYFYYPGDSQNDEGYYFSGSCKNMTITGKSTTAISNVENSNKDVVATEYFDLSGRRISNAAQGVSIMVSKYADGTSKAIKIMK